MKRIFIASFVFLCSQSWAVTYKDLSTTTPAKRFYVSAGAGEMFPRVSGTNYLGTGGGWPDDHYTSSRVSNQPFALIAAGCTWLRKENWLPSYSLGFRLMYISSAIVSGYIDQYSLPEFRNYRFSYNAQLTNLLATLKADLYRWHNWMPYVLLSAGVAHFQTSDYKERALSDVTPRVNPGFNGTSGNNFAYQLGVGFDYALRKNLWVNIEYDYANYGTVSTGKGVNYSTLTGANYDNESLRNKIAATALFLGFTYYT